MDETLGLVSACISGDRKAQNRLYRELRPILAKVCRQYCKTDEDTEDVLAVALARIFMNLDKYKGTSMPELVAWSKAIAQNKAIDKISMDTALKRRGLNVGYGEIQEQRHSVKNTASPDREFILAMMADMPEKPRTVFMMHEIEGYPYSEMTVMLGMKMNAIKTNYHRARKWLMGRIDADMRKADGK